jgi:hypothetical protein
MARNSKNRWCIGAIMLALVFGCLRLGMAVKTTADGSSVHTEVPRSVSTCTTPVTVAAVDDLGGTTVYIATIPAICVCKNNAVRLCGK